MQIDKQTILKHLQDQGDTQKADQADKELPEQVDTEKDSGLLSKFGVDPQALLGKLGGGGGIPGL